MMPEAAKHRTHARRQRERQGRVAETIAAWYLRLGGYQILAQRLRTPVGEIDIVARRGHMLAIVEVKSRSDPAAVDELVTARQRQRISRATLFFLARHRDRDNLAVRYDLVLVRPWKWPRHLANAWRDGD